MPEDTRSPFIKGTLIELRKRGVWHLYQITDDYTTWHTGVCMETVPAGTTIHRCVWKKDNLEERSVRIKREPATKTVEEWQQECAANLASDFAAQRAYHAIFDRIVAKCANADDPDELMHILADALIKGEFV